MEQTKGFASDPAELARRYVPRLGEKFSAVAGMALIGVAFAGLGYAIGVAKSAPLRTFSTTSWGIPRPVS